MRWSNLPFWLRIFLGFGVSALFVFAGLKYPGNIFYYIYFSLVSNLLLYFGFREKAIFFDTFIGFFFWLGFWVKLAFRLIFFDGHFIDAGGFDGSPAAFDKAVLVSALGLSALVLASFVRAKYIFSYPDVILSDPMPGLFRFYASRRKLWLSVFLFFFVLVGALNIHMGIYQRGEVARTILPFGLSGVVTWLLLFGMASFVAVILSFEYRLDKKNYWLLIIYSFVESMVSSVSQLSRGMVMNSGAILNGVIYQLRDGGLKLRVRNLALVIFAFFVLFFSSAAGVTYVRSHSYIADAVTAKAALGVTQKKALPDESIVLDEDFKKTVAQKSLVGLSSLFLDRWVGLEGVMAVSTYPKLGWELWRAGWAEVYNENALSFYDSNIINSSYLGVDTSRFHFVSLSGIVAFFFYPGSYFFLFLAIFSLGLVAALIEIFVYRFGGRNVILCSLFGQIIAYRFMSFGYVPAQSYLLFGSIVVNVLIIHFADKVLTYRRYRFAS